MDEEAIDERLRAVERALSDGEATEGVADAAAMGDRVEAVERDLEAVEERLDELDAAVQALRGYVGAVRGVNRDVERRADSALAKVERLEADVDRRARSEFDRGEDPQSSPGAGATGVGEHPIPERDDTERRGLLSRIGAWL